jgi:hypothetical protein
VGAFVCVCVFVCLIVYDLGTSTTIGLGPNGAAVPQKEKLNLRSSGI